MRNLSGWLGHAAPTLLTLAAVIVFVAVAFIPLVFVRYTWSRFGRERGTAVLRDVRQLGVRSLRGWLGHAAPILPTLAAAVIVVVAVVFILPPRLARPTKGPIPITPAERLKAENDARATLIQGLGGLALLTGVYFTARTLKVNREGQITERFTRAIDQLGNGNLDVRLGGIYALERIARDSEPDHGPIMEVLTAFVRVHAKWDVDEPQPANVAPDVQAVVRVVARRPAQRRRTEDQPLDLSGVDLRGASLGGAHLEGANLFAAHLEGADLVAAHLEGANLGGAHLEGAIFVVAHLEKALLAGAHLEGANLGGAHLEGTIFVGAHLEGANLERAHLNGADLRQAYLEGANLDRARGLVTAQLEEAHSYDKTQLPQSDDS